MAAPKVVNAINRPFPVTVEVHFDQVLLVDDELLEPSNYLFNRGAFATTVELVDDKQVRLTVENLFDFGTFTVSVSSSVKGFTGESVNQSANSATFSLANRPSVDSSFLSISAENGRLKSGIRALQVQKKNDNWYIRTESGFDVVDSTSFSNNGFVLDGYGFNTIFVG